MQCVGSALVGAVEREMVKREGRERLTVQMVVDCSCDGYDGSISKLRPYPFL